VVINDLNVERVSVLPLKTDTPLLVIRTLCCPCGSPISRSRWFDGGIMRSRTNSPRKTAWVSPSRRFGSPNTI